MDIKGIINHQWMFISRYNPVTQKWVVDECVLKLDKEPFAHGAMRECYRM